MLQNELMQKPDRGSVIKAAGGLRKIRMGLPGLGKRGGARVIYLFIPERDTVVLISLYTKRKKEDINSKERELLSQMAQIIKHEITQ